MSRLAQQQQALLDALLGSPTEAAAQALAGAVATPWARGLQVYRANGRALAQRALGAAYPVLVQLLGEDSFSALAQAFWQAQPPRRGDMNQWGETLADFLAGDAQLQDLPYLPDVARLEWALHRCAQTADATAEPASYQRLMDEDPARLTLVLAPGCTLLASAWPVASIVTAHHTEQPDLGTAAERLRAGLGETALVWREGLRPRVRAVWPGEAALLSALQAGASLAAALEMAHALDFAAWLPMAGRTGLLLAVHPLHSNSLEESAP